MDKTKYQSIEIFYQYEVIGYYYIDNNTINFEAVLRHRDRAIVYSSWSRKTLGFFDPDTMPDEDPKIRKIYNKFYKMGAERLANRFETLWLTREQFSE